MNIFIQLLQFCPPWPRLGAIVCWSGKVPLNFNSTVFMESNFIMSKGVLILSAYVHASATCQNGWAFPVRLAREFYTCVLVHRFNRPRANFSKTEKDNKIRAFEIWIVFRTDWECI